MATPAITKYTADDPTFDPTKAKAPAGLTDPFAASGGGTYANGGWIPNNNPDAIAKAQGTPAPIGNPTAAPASPAAPAAPASGDYPSLPPGATPPPGYYDPLSGKTAPGGAPAAAATPASPATPAAPGATPATPAAEPTTIADAFKTSLIDMLNGANKTPTMDDPTIKAQADAYAVQQTRASEAQRAQAAERLAAQGLGSSGAADTTYSDLLERQGENQGTFNAGLLGKELQDRRQQLIQAASIAGNTLNAEQARALQKELADLDAQIRREGIAAQGSIAGAANATQQYGINTNANLGLLQALLGNQFNNASLTQQGNQFGQGLDTSTILGLIGGLH